jgi:hypothetical protein
MKKYLKNKLRNSWLRVIWFYIVDVFNYLRYKFLKRDLVLVYQMGKVASSSIYNSLKGKNLVVYQIHRFNREYIDEVHKALQLKTGFIESKIVDERGIRLNRMFLKKHKRPIYLISLVRDPIERNISAFFQNKEHFAKKHEYSNIDELIQLFYDLYDHDTPLTWFEREFKRTTGVDIYDHPFPREKRHGIFKSNNFNILLLRIDLNDSQKEQILREFLEKDNIKLKNRNVGSTKSYNSEYKNFNSNIKLNEKYVSKMLESKFVKHFYTKEEIEAMRIKWLN